MLTFREKFSYAIGRLGSSITIDMTDLFTGFVYIAFFGLEDSPLNALGAVALGKLVIAITSYLAGYYSDRLNTRWGRRKPFVIFGAPILALSFFMLYSPHLFLPATADTTLITMYLLLWNAIYQAMYGIVLTPFQSLLPEIATEEERLEVSGYQNTVNFIAFIIGAGAAFLIPSLLGDIEGAADFQILNNTIPFLTNGLVITFFVTLFSLCVIVFFLPSLFVIDEKQPNIPKRNIREEFGVVFSNKNYLYWTLSRGVLSITISGLLGIVLAWIQDVLQVPYILFGVILLVSIFIGLYFWIGYGNKQGKTKTYIYSMTYLAIIMPFMAVISLAIIPLDNLIQGSIFGFLAAIGMAGYYLLPYAIVADIVEKDEQETAESRSGIYYGFEAIPLNFFQFLGYLLVGALLDNRFWNIFNIDGLFTNASGTSFSLGYVLFGPIASIFIVLSVLIFWKFVDADPLQKSDKN
jgi:GPH family glycoside/pentoside/hexuronide:cation symporter